MKHRAQHVSIRTHSRGSTRHGRRRNRDEGDGRYRCLKVMCGVFAILALVGLVWWFINAVSLTERLPMTGNEPEDYMEEEQVRQQIEELKNTIRTGRNSLRSRHKIESPAHTSDRRSPNPRDEWGSPNISDNSSDGFRSPESVKETEKVKSSSADIPMKRDSEKQHQPPQFLSRNGAITPRGVLGEPMYGQSPVRRPLTSDENLIRNPVPLIVGGTDGSGTRGVVALLQRLNVIMVVEDLGTLDVHGTPYMASGGWPHVVRPVVEWAGGANYDASAAPESLRTSTLEALGNLKTKMESAAKKDRNKQRGQVANYVSWGFKAPVSMLLVPFFQEAWGRAKFLHVVRDGRDIAFSGNQTPVSKFYDQTFGPGSKERQIESAPLKAIKMWSVWNSGLYQWATRRAAGGASHTDYLMLHVEDLIDPAAKFAAIKDVAEFVGSTLSDKELCCIATEGARDLGSHTTAKADRGKVTTRFGKWKGKVQDDPSLSRSLHQEGGEGLRVLGYEPERAVRSSDGYQCREERELDCPALPVKKTTKTWDKPQSQPRPKANVPDVVTDTSDCVGMKLNTDFLGEDMTVGNYEEHLGCCHECQKLTDCTHFTFDYMTGNCYLKSGKGVERTAHALVSGAVVTNK